MALQVHRFCLLATVWLCIFCVEFSGSANFQINFNSMKCTALASPRKKGRIKNFNWILIASATVSQLPSFSTGKMRLTSSAHTHSQTHHTKTITKTTFLRQEFPIWKQFAGRSKATISKTSLTKHNGIRRGPPSDGRATRNHSNGISMIKPNIDWNVWLWVDDKKRRRRRMTRVDNLKRAWIMSKAQHNPHLGHTPFRRANRILELTSNLNENAN